MARNIRLRDTAKRQVRVRDLAKELGVEAKAVMQFLKDIGEFVGTSASNIEEPVARKVREAFAGPSEARARDPRPNPVPQTAAVNYGLSAPTQRDRRENNPYALPQERPRDRWVLPYRKDNETRSDGEGRYVSETPDPGADDYSAALAYPPSQIMKDWEWKVRGDISEAERDVWLSHGLRSDQARIAAECIEARIQPSDLASDVNGVTILHRVTHGEPPAEVARLWRRGIA